MIATFTRITIRSSVQQNGIVGPIGTKKAVPQRSQWCRSANRRIHDHDVRAMAICHDKLCSGGNYLCCVYTAVHDTQVHFRSEVKFFSKQKEFALLLLFVFFVIV